MPKPEDIDTSGLEITKESMDELLHVDKDQWLHEMESIKEYFQEYGDRMPQRLLDEHGKVVKALEQSD